MKKITKYNSKKGSSSKSSNGGTFLVGGSAPADYVPEAAHATNADYAKKAGEAAHAQSSSTLDPNSDVRLDIKDIKQDLAGLSDEYLSKTHDDSTRFKLTMGAAEVKGDATVGGDAKSSGFLSASDSGTPAGWALRLLQGIATGELDDLIVRRNAKVRDLTVTGAAHFFKLIIDEIKSAGGSVLLTPANGFIAERVTHHGTVGGEDERYILYWRDSDGEKTIDNQWMVGDFAVCMTANLKQGVNHNAGNKTWWCKVVESGNSGGYNYISLDWHGRAQGRTITDGGKTFTEATSSGVPEAGDNVAMLGSVATDNDGHFDYKRQSAIYLAAYDSLDMGLETPFLAFYYGIDDFCLSRHRKTHLSRLATNIVADKFTVHSDEKEYPISVFFGDWSSDTVYPKAGVVNYNGCTWTSLKDGNQGNIPSSTSEWWVSNKGEAGKSADAYDITFRLNGVAVTTLNYDTIRATDGEVAIEAVFSNNGSEFTADEATLGCYDERGVLMGLAVTGRDSGGIVVDGGELYLSPDCSSIQCSFSKGGRTLCSRSLTVIRNGRDGVTIAKTEYKYIISDSADAAINWDGLIAHDKPPMPEVAPGKYLHVMTIVTYSDGTVTSTVTISYCGTDGDSLTVKDTSVTYAVTDTATQPADSAFTYKSVPEVKNGQYLWCKTVVTFSDGTSTKSYAVSRVGSDGDQGYSLHFAYADDVVYSGTKPTVTNFSTTRMDTSEWLGVNRSLQADDPTDPTVYEWTKIKGEDGRDAYKLEVISSAGLVYRNNTLSTVLSAHVYGPDGEVTDKCNGTFTWYDISGSSPTQKGTGKTLSISTSSGAALESYRFRCKYDGDISTNN